MESIYHGTVGKIVCQIAQENLPTTARHVPPSYVQLIKISTQSAKNTTKIFVIRFWLFYIGTISFIFKL